MPQHKKLWLMFTVAKGRFRMLGWAAVEKSWEICFPQHSKCRKSSKVNSSHPFVQFVSGKQNYYFPTMLRSFELVLWRDPYNPFFIQFLNTWAAWGYVWLSKERWNVLLFWSWGDAIFPFTFHFYLWRTKQVLCRNFLTAGEERHKVTSCRSSHSMHEPMPAPAS